MKKVNVDEIPIPAILVGRPGIIIDMNSLAETLLGYTFEEICGQPINILVPEEYRKNHEKNMEVYWTKMYHKKLGTGRDLQARRKDGAIIEVEIGLYPYSSNVLVLMLNILDRKLGQIAEEMQSLSKRIDDLKLTWEE